MKQIVSVIAACIFMSSCSTVGSQLSDIVFIPNGKSAKRQDADINLQIAYSDQNIGTGQVQDGKNSFDFLSGGTASILAGLVIDQIGASLTEEARRYQATYSAQASGFKYFFEDDNTGIKFAGFAFNRYIPAKTSKKDEEPRLALSVCAIALPNPDSSFIYIVPVSYSVNYTKAKLIGFDLLSPFGVDLLNPWEILSDPLSGEGFKGIPADNDLDIKVGVGFDFLHYDENGNVRTTSTEVKTFDIKNVQLGQSQLFPAFKTFIEETELKNFIEVKSESTETDNSTKFMNFLNRDFKKTESDDSDTITKNTFELNCAGDSGSENVALLRDIVYYYIHNTKYDHPSVFKLFSQSKSFPIAKRAFANRGNGNFVLKVEISEFDDYGERINEISDAFETKKDSWQENLSDLLNGN